jgi:hypothetical protein
MLFPMCLLVLASCVPSLNPLYTAKDLVFEEKLVGTWSQDAESWAFEKSGDKKYKLRQTDKEGRTGEFEVHLVNLRNHLFLDLLLVNPGAESEWKVNQYAAFGLIMRPGHMFMKVKQITPSLQISFMNPDWLKDYLQKNPKAIRHEQQGASGAAEQIILTADTKDLQTFILKHMDDEKAFGDFSDMTRKVEPASPQPEKRP